MRVVSMVPSWTETLIAANVNVVGRTRFCIHPETSIPVVGGTKSWDWEKIVALKPDLLVLDKEENPVMMSEQKEISYIATHVNSIKDMPIELNQLSTSIENLALAQFAVEWEQILLKPKMPRWKNGMHFPGIIEWGCEPRSEIKKLI